MEAATAVESAATCEVRATANIAAATTGIPVDPADITVTDIAAAPASVAMAVVATVIAAVVGVIRVVASVVVVEARTIPGTGSNEDASYEPVRTVVAIGVRINRCRVSLISGNADSDSHRNLCVRLCGWHQNDAEYCQQSKIFEKPHLVTSWAQCFKAESGV